MSEPDDLLGRRVHRECFQVDEALEPDDLLGRVHHCGYQVGVALVPVSVSDVSVLDGIRRHLVGHHVCHRFCDHHDVDRKRGRVLAEHV